MEKVINQELMDIIDEIKFKYKISQSEIADGIGVSKQHLSDVINGRFPLSEKLRLRLRNKYVLNDNVDKDDMEQTVKQRLIEYLRFKKIGFNKFESKAGISNGYIANLKNAPRPVTLTKILQAAPDLNRVWLLTGEGSMIIGNDVSPVVEQEVRPYTTNGHGVRFYEQQDGQILMQTPIVQFDALGSPEDDYTELVASREEGELASWIVDSVHQGKYYSFVVDNDSMDDGSRDSFQKGDMVLVRELDKQDWLPHLYINKWRFWVVCFGNCIRIKEIVAQDMDAGTITLHSLNPSPEYTDFTLRLDQVSRLFNVVQLQPKKRVF